MANKVLGYVDEPNIPSTYNNTNKLSPEEQYLADMRNLINNFDFSGGGGGSVGNYTNQAKALLGELDTSAYDQLRDAYNASYGTQKQSLEQSYATLMEQLAKQTTSNKQQFGEARGTIAEDSFTRNRDLYRNLAQRGLGASGLAQLGGLQNRMETGKQVSKVANQYYDTSEKIADTTEQGTNQYNTQGQQLSNALGEQLANVANQEMQYKNAYQQQLANLAVQLQQAAAQSAAASAAMRYNKLQAQMQLEQEELGFQQASKANTNETAKFQILNSDASTYEKTAAWMEAFGVDRATAQNEMRRYQTEIESSLKSDVLKNYQDTYDTHRRNNARNNLWGYSLYTDKDLVNKFKADFKSGALTYQDVYNFFKKNEHGGKDSASIGMNLMSWGIKP